MSRGEIDPASIYESLPNTAILDVSQDCRAFHFRYAGTDIDGRRGQFLTHKCVSDLDNCGLDQSSVEVLQDVVASREPRYFQGEYRDLDGSLHRYERVAMPLSSDGKTIDGILAGLRYTSVEFPELEEIDLACYG